MKFIPESVTRNFGRKVLVAKKNSPHIFFAAGVVGFAGTVVLACKATTKLEQTLDEIHEEIKEVKDKSQTPTIDDKEHFKDLGYVYGKSAAKLTRLYGPSIILGVASVGALTGSHVQLTRRNSALTATLAALTKAYDDYRVRVADEIGAEKELDIYRGVTEETIEDENKKKQVVKVVNPNALSEYARIFDEACPDFKKNAEMNRIFLTAQQNYFNQLLRARGHVFLNEVYDALGFERSKAGQVVGWVINGDGDDYVDFGMFEARCADFINGHEPRVILDFNVDGIVYDKF